MNKLISKTKIETCEYTWNPCYGCLNGCRYCYAKKFAKRFAKNISTNEAFYLLRKGMINQDDLNVVLDIGKEIETKIRDFQPIFLEANFNKEFPQKTQKIFIGSMSEIRFWKRAWLMDVFEKIKKYPQHNFQFLTKYPYIYHRYEFPSGSWLGFTVNTMKDLAEGIPHIEKVRMMNLSGKYLYYICIEPILEGINPLGILFIDWVILGAETGKHKDKIIPKKEWIEDIVDYCERDKIPIYLKDNLKGIYLEEIKEFPKMESIDARSK